MYFNSVMQWEYIIINYILHFKMLCFYLFGVLHYLFFFIFVI